MSQHIFPVTLADGRRAIVLAGYDRPLNGCFAVVEIQTADEPVYCNLDDPELFGTCGMARDIDHFVPKLAALGITFPAAVIEAIRHDTRERTSNRHVEYDEHGVEQGGV
jgi:hypothetical protein